jgi:hypothetical protein
MPIPHVLRPLLLLTFSMALLLALVLFLPALALAQDGAPPPAPTLALPTDQIWTLIAGALAPLGAYVLNYAGPHTSEKIKAGVQIVLAAIAGGIVQAITAGGVGFNTTTLQFVLGSVIAALAAHKILWQPATISTALGGGRNKVAAPPG